MHTSLTCTIQSECPIREDESNLNESVENPIDPNQNSLDTNGSDDDRDTASDNDNDRLNALLHKPVPSAEGNEVVINAINFFNTLPTPPDPLFPDGMVNTSSIWVRPAGWVPPESSSADSFAAQPGDASEVNIPLPPTTQSQSCIQR